MVDCSIDVPIIAELMPSAQADAVCQYHVIKVPTPPLIDAQPVPTEKIPRTILAKLELKPSFVVVVPPEKTQIIDFKIF